MKLVVRNTLGETVSLQIRSDETFIGLKERVEEEAGISLDLKDIALRGKRVTEEQKVEEYFLAYANGMNAQENNSQYCVVPGCKNTKLLNPDKVFFEFPTEEIRCHQWVMYCQRHYTGPGKDRLNITAESTICSDHFLPDQFVKNAHTLLKRTAIPSVKPVRVSCDEYDFVSSKEKQSSSSDEDPVKIHSPSKRLCRLCAGAFIGEDMFMIFSNHGDDLSIADKINLCLPVKVRMTDPFPKQVCRQCYEELSILYKLADMCTLTQRKMQNIEKENMEKMRERLCNVTLITTGDNGKENVLFETSLGEEGLVKTSIHESCPLCVEGSMKVVNNELDNSSSLLPPIEENSEESVADNENIINSTDIRSDGFNNSFSKNNKPDYSSDEMIFKRGTFEDDIVNKQGNDTLLPDINTGNIGGICLKTEPLDDGYSDLNIGLISSENLYKDQLDPVEFMPDNQNVKQEINPFNTIAINSDPNELLQTLQDEIEQVSEISDHSGECFYCRICAVEFKTVNEILLHSFGHSYKGFYQCSFCVSFYTDRIDIESHLRKHEERFDIQRNSDSEIQCEVCNKLFSTKQGYVAHQCLSDAEIKYDGNRCPVCQKSFRSESRLKFHMKFHNTKSPGYCEICDKSFPDELKLYKHSIYVHNSSKGHFCEECGKVFKTEASMRYHQHSVHNDSIFKPYTCDRCGKAFIRKSMLMNHMTSSHKNVDFEASCFTCKLCSEAFPSTSAAVAHMDNQHKMECMDDSTYSFDMITLKRLFVCEFCERCYAEASVLNSHRDQHPSDTPYECKICELTFASSEEVKCHRRVHKTRDIPAEYLTEFLIPNTYLCEYCERCFLNYVKYKEHLTIHYGQEPYQCRHCEMKFSSLQLAMQHRAQHGEISSHLEESNFYRPYECHYCNKSFAIEDALVKHIRMHTGEKPFVCNQCGKGFSQSSGLYTHQKVHSSLRPYVCPLCPRTFKIKGDRDVHVRKHSGDRPYKCEFCKKAFMTQHVYSQHRKIHTGERPYKCDVCGIAFRRSHVLTVHKRIHTGEKPNICDICGKRYRQKGDMLKHKRLQHGLTRDYNLANRIGPTLDSPYGLSRIS